MEDQGTGSGCMDITAGASATVALQMHHLGRQKGTRTWQAGQLDDSVPGCEACSNQGTLGFM